MRKYLLSALIFLGVCGNAAYAEGTDVSAYDNVIYVADCEAEAGKEVTLSVQMNNVMEVAGFQFNMYLPQGITFSKNDKGIPKAALSTARTTSTKTNTFNKAIQSDGSLLVVCGTSRSNTKTGKLYCFSGNTGEVCTVTIVVPADYAEGDYDVLLKNIELTDPDNHSNLIAETIVSTLSISLKLGDADDDGDVDSDDVTAVANYILTEQAPAQWSETKANANQLDGIEVGDIITIEKMIAK